MFKLGWAWATFFKRLYWAGLPNKRKGMEVSWSNSKTAKKHTHTHTHTNIEKVADRIQRQRARSRDVDKVAAAGRAKTADERSSGPIKEAWYAFRDCLLQEQGPLLALWRVSVFFFPFLSFISNLLLLLFVIHSMFIFRMKR
jgi:hypothetical protein